MSGQRRTGGGFSASSVSRQTFIRRFRQVVSEFGRKTGMGEITAGEDHNVRLIFDDSLEVDIEGSPDQNALYFHAPLPGADRFGRGDREEAEFFLHASLFHPRARGGNFSFDRELRELVLFHCLPLRNLELEVFEEELMVFVEALEHWREFLAHGLLEVSRARAARPAETESSHAIKA